MAIPLFLAMTRQEISPILPKHMAWMSCHFCPYEKGLTDLPPPLPPGSMLILDDRIEPDNHDPIRIRKQLQTLEPHFSSILLDFQRENLPLLQSIAMELCQNLALPVAVTPPYAASLSCPVFLPPAPPHRPLTEHLLPWQGRPIWLELSRDSSALSITESGCTETPPKASSAPIHSAEDLCSHYQIDSLPQSLLFTFQRTDEDLLHLIDQAKTLGVEKCVGLYQQLWNLDTETAPTILADSPPSDRL